MYTGYADVGQDESMLGDDTLEPACNNHAAAEHEETDGFVSQQSDTAARCAFFHISRVFLHPIPQLLQRNFSSCQRRRQHECLYQNDEGSTRARGGSGVA